MNLGDKACFKKHLIKNPEIEEFVDNEGEPVQYTKRVIKELDKPKKGIIVGRRRVGKVSTFQWEESDAYTFGFSSYGPDGRWYHIGTQYETVYLVACNLTRTYIVRPDDLQVLENEEVAYEFANH